MEILLGGLCLVIGLVAGIFIGKMVFKVESETSIQMITAERDRILQDKVPLERRIVDLERATATVETEKANLEKRLSDQKEEIEKLHRQLTLEFENLAKKIFAENASSFRETSEKNITTL